MILCEIDKSHVIHQLYQCKCILINFLYWNPLAHILFAKYVTLVHVYSIHHSPTLHKINY